MQIHNLQRAEPDPVGRLYWRAEIINGDDVHHVDTLYGSWQLLHEDGRRSDLRAIFAARLQAQARKLERKERKGIKAEVITA